MPRQPRTLTDADLSAWAVFARQIIPLPGRPALPDIPPPPAQPAALPPWPKSPADPRPTRLLPQAVRIGDQPGGVDTASWHRFRGGKLTAERKLDLHGLTTQRAFQALASFLRTAHADRVRCVEIVTGRGSTESTGTIRREFPLWLNLPDIRPLILAAAHPHAANPGSVRLLLRRIR